jgi:hypothetical protein
LCPLDLPAATLADASIGFTDAENVLKPDLLQYGDLQKG